MVSYQPVGWLAIDLINWSLEYSSATVDQRTIPGGVSEAARTTQTEERGNIPEAKEKDQ